MEEREMLTYSVTTEFLQSLQMALAQTDAGLRKVPGDLQLTIRRKKLVNDITHMKAINESSGYKVIRYLQKEHNVQFEFLKPKDGKETAPGGQPNEPGTVQGPATEANPGTQTEQVQRGTDGVEREAVRLEEGIDGRPNVPVPTVGTGS